MVWLQAFPTPATNVSDVGQTQANWLFLQQTIGTDHFFNTLDNRNGHHQFVQMLGTGADFVPAAGMNGVFYDKLQGVNNVPQMFWQENVFATIRQIPTILTGTLAYPVINNIVTIFNLAATPFSSGIFTLFQLGSANIYYQAFIVFDNVGGGTIYRNNVSQNGNFIINSVVPSQLNFTSAAIIGNFRWNLFTIPN